MPFEPAGAEVYGTFSLASGVVIWNNLSPGILTESGIHEVLSFHRVSVFKHGYNTVQSVSTEFVSTTCTTGHKRKGLLSL